jgi:hypothetical protein
MKNVTLLIIILTFTNFSQHTFAQKNIPIQAEPLLDVLVSVKENNIQRFKGAFSNEIAREKKDWNSDLQEGKKNLIARFGDYKLQDFEFMFSGDHQEGKVVLYFQNEPQFSLAVVKEPQGWKLNEH